MTMFALSNPVPDREWTSPTIGGAVTFGEVESVIDRADLSDDQKSALWLLAFSRLDADNQQRIAEDAWVGAARGI